MNISSNTKMLLINEVLLCETLFFFLSICLSVCGFGWSVPKQDPTIAKQTRIRTQPYKIHNFYFRYKSQYD